MKQTNQEMTYSPEREYGAILTEIGAEKLLAHSLANTKMELTEFSVGDANGEYYQPTETMTALKNEKWRGKVIRVEVPPLSTNTLEIESFIDASIGGFGILEMAVFDKEGDMIAISNTPLMEKAHPESGAATSIYPQISILVSQTEQISVIVDASDTEAVKREIERHNTSPAAHPYTNEKLPGVENVGEALTVLTEGKMDGKWKLFTSLSQLSLEDSPDLTVADVVGKMPDSSSLLLSVTGRFTGDLLPYPKYSSAVEDGHGILHITKLSTMRIGLLFVSHNNRRWIATYTGPFATPFSGWKRFSIAEPPKEHKLLLTGNFTEREGRVNYFYKTDNNIVGLVFSVEKINGTPLSEGETILTLPEGFRPEKGVYSNCLLLPASGVPSNSGSIAVSAGGSVVVTRVVPTIAGEMNKVHGNLTFLAARN